MPLDLLSGGTRFERFTLTHTSDDGRMRLPGLGSGNLSDNNRTSPQRIVNRHNNCIVFYRSNSVEIAVFINKFKDDEANTEYCPYCLEVWGDKIQCCHEAHRIPFGDLAEQEQNELAMEAWDNLRSNKC